MTIPKQKQAAFTLVELLITVAVIAILAGVSIVAYVGMQERARDARRKNDISIITEALDLYYIKNGVYPDGNGSTTINSSWSTTADASWGSLVTELSTYAEEVPEDPISTPGAAVTSGVGYNYAYFSNRSAGVSYCGANQNQMYILLYRLEGSAQTNTLIGDCTTTVLGPYANASNYRLVR